MSKIRKSAKNEECQVRISPFECAGNDTVVLAHLGGAGMALKQPDLMGAYACSVCHAYADGQRHAEYTADEIFIMFCKGIFRTQQILIDKGLITIK